MNEFHVHQVVPDNNSIVGGFIMVLKHHRVGRSVMLLTHYSTEEGLLWHKDKGGNIPAIVVWADFSTVEELQSRA